MKYVKDKKEYFDERINDEMDGMGKKDRKMISIIIKS